MQSVDVVIAGGGIVGLTLAVALAELPINILVLEPENPESNNDSRVPVRVSAFNRASQQLLRRLGVWQRISADDIAGYSHMHVWEQDSMGSIEFDCPPGQGPELGHIIANDAVRRALLARLQPCTNVSLVNARLKQFHQGSKEAFLTLDNGDMVSYSLLVGADGANSVVRKQADFALTFWDYQHTAIVATIKSQQPHQNTARQVFTSSGPLAFLPLADPYQCSIVWSQQTEQADALLAMSETAFNQALTATFNATLGVSELVTDRVSFPLRMRYARQWIKPRVAIIGDAAHTIHPLAGQGVNLGLMDAAALAQTLTVVHHKQGDLGEVRHLRAFERWRKADAMEMCAAMEGFKRLYASQLPGLKLVRGVGMRMLDQLPGIKNIAIQQAMGLSGDLPELAK